ncbi:MAG: hypothetical protein QOD77_1389 [Thermoplasmata archaeon]|nr:hypothetical protein [Thermoplasmata archaeon]
MVFDADVREEGLVQFGHLARNQTGPAPTLTIEAARITTIQYEDQGHEARAPFPQDVPFMDEPDSVAAYTGQYMRSLGQAPEPVENSGRDARLVVGGAQAGFTIIVFNEASTLRHDAQTTSPRVGVLQEPILTHMGIADNNVPIEQQSPQASPYWSRPQASSPHVHSASAGPATVTWRGDFTLEAVGISGEVATPSRAWAFESGRWESALAPGQPGQESLHEVREVFLRVLVEDGVLTFSSPDAAASWSGPSLLSTYVQGVAVVQSATGMVAAADDPPVHVSSPQLELRGPQGLAARPEGSVLDLDLVPVDAEGHPIPDGPVYASPPDAILEGVAAGTVVLVAGLACTYLVYRRMRRLPILADVEAALEANAFRRAARDARRILLRRPDSEDAMLSRAIALSKSGRHRVVVREVRHHLQTRRPTDGVLHYVLGVAQHELGRLEEARSSFEEAVRRTPALLKDVQERMGRAATTSAAPPVRPPSPPEPRDASGYA